MKLRLDRKKQLHYFSIKNYKSHVQLSRRSKGDHSNGRS